MVRQELNEPQKSTVVCDVIPKDKRSWYNYRHSELLGYLKSALEISQPQRHEEALKAIQAKCIEDQFDVVLLGEFQDGKSTTLDVLCRGRELSPQGDRIKSTSAVPVSIEAARPERAPAGFEEWAELRFKSEQQIKDEIFDAFEVYLTSEESNVADGLKPFVQGDGNGTAKEVFREKFNLQSPEHLEIVRQIAGVEWTAYAKDHGCLSTYYRQQLEVLTIYLKFYGTPEYKAVSERTIVSVPDIAKLVYFPRNWKERSPSSLDFDLAFDECVFAFLDFAVLHINSKVLSQLNCRITDCPGLGASAYDTSVARRALTRADGVWFVKRCDKQLSASTLGAIFDLIKNNGRLARTGMALNLWMSHKKSLVDDPKAGTCLVKYCEEQLIKEGYKFPVFWCNARFAYLSALGQRKIEDGTPFAANERNWMINKVIEDEDCDPNLSDEELWVEAVKAANLASKVGELKSIEAFGQEAVDLLWKHSNMDNALEVMAKIVLEQKGHAILIANGSQKAFEILKRYEQELQLVEDNATREANHVKAELDKARERMRVFKEDAEKAKRSSPPFGSSSDNVIDALTSEYVQFAIGDKLYEMLAERCAEAAHDLNRSYHWTEESFKDEFDRQIHPILREMIRDRYANYSNEIWKPYSVKSNVREFFENVESLNEDLAKLVKKLEQEGGDLFKSLPLPKVGEFVAPESGISTILKSLKPVCEELRQGFFGDVISMLSTIINILTFGGLGYFFGKSKEQVVNEAKQKLKPAIEKILADADTRAKIESSVRPMFEQALKSASEQVDAGIAQFEAVFEARCRELEAANAESDERKREIAAANHKIRTEKVQPLREKLEIFEKSVSEELQ